jgi:hypothetical protein
MTEKLLSYIRDNFSKLDKSNKPLDLDIFDDLIKYLSSYQNNQEQISKYRNFPVPVKHIVEILEDIKSKIPYFDIEEFIHLLNQHFLFFVSDYESFFERFYKKEIKNIIGVSINDITTENMLAKLLNFDKLASFITFSPHIYVLQFFLYKQGTIQKKRLSMKRPLEWSDFQDEIHKRLTYDNLLKVLDFYSNNLSYISENNKLDIEKTIEYVALKTTRLNKFFIIDILSATQDIENIKDIDIVTELNHLNLKYDKLIKFTICVYSPFIKQLERILQEIELIGILMKFNILFLDTKEAESENLLKEFINSNSITNHQACLLTQTISQQLYENINLNKNLKDILQKIFDNNLNLQRCVNYINSSKKVYCYHETFLFYSIYKWYLIFINLISKYATKNFDLNISPESYKSYHNNFLDPKISFCNSCYNHYKEYEKQISHKGLQNNFIIYTNKSYSTIFRQVFSDTCDIPLGELYKKSQLKHFKEYLNSENSVKNLLSKVFLELKKEIFRSQKVIQNYINDTEKLEQNFSSIYEDEESEDEYKS